MYVYAYTYRYVHIHMCVYIHVYIYMNYLHIFGYFYSQRFYVGRAQRGSPTSPNACARKIE